MKKNKNQIQQGDVLLKVISELPKDCKRLKTRTVALGEATGHHHTFEEGVALFEGSDKTVYAVNETEESRPLTHQEHHKTRLAPGQICEFGQVREFDWLSKMVRPVQD